MNERPLSRRVLMSGMIAGAVALIVLIVLCGRVLF